MKHLAYLVMGTVGIGAALGLGLTPPAHAETGTKPHLDHLCTHPAFVAASVNGLPLVGLRAQNDYCGSDEFKHPADYGSGPQLLP